MRDPITAKHMVQSNADDLISQPDTKKIEPNRINTTRSIVPNHWGSTLHRAGGFSYGANPSEDDSEYGVGSILTYKEFIEKEKTNKEDENTEL